MFARQNVSRSTKPPGSLLLGPHCNYEKAKEYYNNYQNCYYHKLCAAMFDSIIQTDVDKSRIVPKALNSSRQKTVKKNQTRLSHIIRTIEFCSRQEIPLRCNRDAVAFSLNATDCNDGVFKPAFRLRVEAADKQTSDLFLKAHTNASYLSWRVQNHIISLMGDAIQKQILSDASDGNYVGYMRVFLSRSAQRLSIFQDNVEREVSGSDFSRQKLKPICATRWVERHDSIIIFVTLLPAVVSTLEELQQENKQVKVATKAATLLNSVQKCTFLIAALVMQHTSGIILPVSKPLQKK